MQFYDCKLKYYPFLFSRLLTFFYQKTLLIATGEAIPLRGLEGVPGLPGAPQEEASLTRKFDHSSTLAWKIP